MRLNCLFLVTSSSPPGRLRQRDAAAAREERLPRRRLDGECHEVEAPDRGPTGQDNLRGRLDPTRPTARRSRRTAAPSRSSSTRSTAPNDGRSLVSLAEKRLLRRHDLPPRRPRLRDPGRRPDRDGQRRARLLDRRHAAARRRVHAGRRRDGEDGDRAPRQGRQPVLRRHRRGHRAPAGVRRSSAGSRKGSTSSTRSASSATETEPPTKPVVIENVTVKSPDRGGRARGRRRDAFRRAQAAAAPSRRARAARRASIRSSSSPVRTSSKALGPCPDWERGPGASLRCGLAALAARRRGGGRRARRRARTRPGARSNASSPPGARAARRSSPRATAGTAAIPCSSPARPGQTIPDEGLRAHEPLLVPCDDLGAPGDVDYPEDLPERFRTAPDEPM